ncbi:Lanthionine synthetase C-like protein [Ekhidna lutea]|uniref:Lanthionine synthetase C-like protein n=1 Tax=Ekhidna lutea TaxID=447679 RepID=A0A239HAJ1_EKHLU|nr:lanthionine synthetase LanC family protein [Ekhidna lutea]SNS78068.1 Lanthionine synthetase C-like protein [Ekhidna lutea]
MRRHTLNLLSYLFIVVLAACSFTDNTSLEKSEKVANWLSQQKLATNNHTIWVDELGEEKVSLSLSSGVSGKVLFYLDLYLSTGEQQYLDEAIIGCEYLVDELPQNVEDAKSIRNGTSLYGDISGSAFILMETYKLTQEEKWKTSVLHCLSLLDSMSIQPDGRYWNNFNDVLVGSAGTGLLLLYLYDELDDPKALQIAKEAAESLEQRAVRNQDSIYWHLNQNNSFNLPNFSHGASGIGYFYARLYETTNDEHYLNISRQVAKYLDLIAWKPENSFLLPYGFPDIGWERAYDIGWAHGPAGTARFFYKLWQVTNEGEWLEIVKQCANGIQYSGMPEQPNDRFGEAPFPIDMRFGTGGVIDFYINLHTAGLIENEAYINALFMELENQAVQDSTTLYWPIERYGFMGGEDGSMATFTGYFYGAAGLGRLYTKRHNLINEREKGIKLPDDPF